MASTIKVNNIQNQCGANIANKCGTTITLGASGDTITLACGASQTGFGRTGTVDWDTTAKTASFTAVSGNGYFVNTTSGAITVTTPASPSAGDIFSLADYAATWQTNNVTVTPNGTDKIGGVNEDALLNTEGQSVTFVYVDSTQGWINTMDSTSNVRGNPPFITATGGTITTCGDYKIHTFTGPGTFCVSNLATSAPENVVSYTVVAGGGSGGVNASANGGAGGGAGGFREYKNSCDSYTASPLNGNPGGTAITVTATGYPITVGGGGAGRPTSFVSGIQGSNSVFSTVTSTGGGGGGGPNANGGSGGSGGGGGGGGVGGTGGAGNNPPVNPSQGSVGGDGGIQAPVSPDHSAGAGGGATASGANASPTIGGTGGTGATTSISGSSSSYAGGGGGGGNINNPNPPGLQGNGSSCGTGGQAYLGPGGAGESGTTNTGGGGGGFNGYDGSSPGPGTSGAGGSGIVIIRYKYQ
jgi:hypothetical protein